MPSSLSESAIKAILEGKNAGDAGKLAKEIHAILRTSAAKTGAQDAASETQYKNMAKALAELNAEELNRQEIAQLQATLDGEHATIRKNKLAAMQEELEIQLLSNDANAMAVQESVKKINKEKEYLKQLERSKDLEEQVAGSTERVGKGLKEAIGYSEDFGQSMLGSMLDMAASTATAEQGFDALIKSMDIDKMHLVENAIEKTQEALLYLGKASWEQMVALDEQQVAFRKTTGLGKEYDQMMKDTYEANKLNGVSVEENAQAMTNLAGTMTDFTSLGTTQKKILTETAGILQENGVATETFAANTQIMNKGLGMSAVDAAQFNTTMVAMAKDIGMAPQELADGFGEVAGTMSALSGGSEAASTAMRGLSATSKATGIAIGRIVDITSQFDTFEGASESVGALNAMLGGDFVNAMDVMAAEDPAERFGMMQQALDDAGKSFDDMAYYEKKAIAESMGLKDTNELAMLMSGNMDDLAGDFGKTSDEIEAMSKAAKANQSISDSWNQLIAQMAPTFQFLIDAVRGFIEMLQYLGPVLPFVGLGLGALFIALIAVRQALMMEALLKNSAMGMQILGSAGFKAGLKIMAGFAIFILLAALIYGVYKWLGPLGGGFALLGLAAVALGVAIATGLTTATGGLYLIIPAIIAGIAGLIGIGYSLYKWVMKMSAGAKVFVTVLALWFWPITLIVGALYALYKIGKYIYDWVVNSSAAMTALKVTFAILLSPILLVLGALYGLYKIFEAVVVWIWDSASAMTALKVGLALLLLPLAPVIVVLWGLYKIIKFVVTAISESTIAMTMLKVGLAILFAPILLVVGALYGLYKIGKYIYEWITNSTAAMTAFKVVMAIVLAPILLIVAAFKGLAAIGKAVLGFFSNVGKKIKDTITAPFKMAAAGVAAVKDKFAAVGSAVKGAVLAPFKAVGKAASAVGGAVAAPFKAIGSVAGRMKDKFKDFGASIKGSVTDKMAAMKEKLKSMPNMFGKMKDKMGELGKKFPILGKAASAMAAPFKKTMATLGKGVDAFKAGGIKGVASAAFGGMKSMMGFQHGGTTPGGPILAGESGPEIIAPPSGFGVLPSPITSMLSSLGGMLGGGGGGGQEVNLNVTLELEGRPLATYIKKVTLPKMNPAGGAG